MTSPRIGGEMEVAAQVRSAGHQVQGVILKQGQGRR